LRAGAYALSLLSTPLNVHVLMALEPAPTPLVELRRAVGSPPQTTMRAQLRSLTEIGVLERRRQPEFPGSVACELGRPGRDLLAVGRSLQDWLAQAPDGGLPLGSAAAKSTIKALVEGWSSTIIRALAARPLSLTELTRLISGLNYPSLERRLGAMRLAGQIEACPGQKSRGTPYRASEWLRRAVAPLAAGASWERRHAVDGGAAPIGRIDVEAAFLLAVPLLSLPPDVSGSCKLAVEVRSSEGKPHLAGVLVAVREGRVVSCVTRLRGEASAWAAGSASAWLDAVIAGEADRLEVGGDCELGLSLVDGLHSALFRVRQRA
jgi:DNA-binding HxlR family transcriptional regulator